MLKLVNSSARGVVNRASHSVHKYVDGMFLLWLEEKDLIIVLITTEQYNVLEV